ncbi:uncharacterized protein A4U43_C08F21290 [Asparagus officinalis]|nr:uncharacterized protein A4U43_C08F21290 [Asparagus officinalis]
MGFPHPKSHGHSGRHDQANRDGDVARGKLVGDSVVIARIVEVGESEATGIQEAEVAGEETWREAEVARAKQSGGG